VDGRHLKNEHKRRGYSLGILLSSLLLLLYSCCYCFDVDIDGDCDVAAAVVVDFAV
jgi:hypothetical protein